MDIRGSALIGADEVEATTAFEAINPATGAPTGHSFIESGEADVERACALAAVAHASFSETTPKVRARFLETIADRLTAMTELLAMTAAEESGLPLPRVTGEVGRTTGQLRLFAGVVREGRWAQATIDHALPDRQPLPRPDLRRRHVAIGPVAVFGASNFPLAFSVAGGDTASALAAGCPVVVKGHPAHPATGELVARAIRAAVVEHGLHDGVFSFLPGAGNAVGGALVRHPAIKAVGFTGSRGGGLALAAIAAARREPIPVYAEMSSVNPVVLLPEALRARHAALAAGFVGSFTLGAGQFCTNPGLLIAVAGPDLDAFLSAAGEAARGVAGQTMLTAPIFASYRKGLDALDGHAAVEKIAEATPAAAGANQAHASLYRVAAADFLADPDAIAAEVFGPSSIVIVARDLAEIGAVVDALEGQLTATLMMDDGDGAAATALLPRLAAKAGRIIANAWPTGVEVCHAMVHGGPYPATSDVRTTSVGTLAIDRFLRPICYQGIPDELLPEALREQNPLGVPRRVDGAMA